MRVVKSGDAGRRDCFSARHALFGH